MEMMEWWILISFRPEIPEAAPLRKIQREDTTPTQSLSWAMGSIQVTF